MHIPDFRARSVDTKTPRFRAWPGLALLLAFVLAGPAREARANCGAEGCPLDPQGPESAAGRFSLDFNYQYIEQDRYWSGHHSITAAEALAEEGGAGHILEQLTLTRTFQATARARVTARLLVTAGLPYLDRIHRHALEHHEGLSIPAEWHMKGLGDATLMAHWTALDGTLPGRGSLSLQIGVKLPTGERHVEEIDDEAPEPAARLGSGSTDGVVGAQVAFPIPVRSLDGLDGTIPLSLGVSARFNGRGTEEYRMGNNWFANLGAAYPVVRRARLLAQINAAWYAADDPGLTDADPHSIGGFSLLASPGVRIDLLPGVTAFGYYQFRLYQQTRGAQLVAPYHLSLGLNYTLGSSSSPASAR